MSAYYVGYIIDEEDGVVFEGRTRTYPWYMQGPVQFAATAILIVAASFGIGQVGRMNTLYEFTPPITATHTGCIAGTPTMVDDNRVSTITCKGGFTQKVDVNNFVAYTRNLDMFFNATGVCNEFGPTLTGGTKTPVCGVPKED